MNSSPKRLFWRDVNRKGYAGGDQKDLVLDSMKIKIGGISLSLKRAGNEAIKDPCYRRFLSTEGGRAHITFEDCKNLPDKRYQGCFDSPGLWSIAFNDHADFCIEVRGGSTRPIAFVQVSVKEKKGCVHIKDPSGLARLSRYRRSIFPCLLPFHYPVDEVIFINILPLYKGILLHACCINDNGNGYIFSGFSGAGKSTMAKQWLNADGAKVLNDDRTIVREIRGLFYAYGTPWHGELTACEPERVRLRAVFIIRHGSKNSIRTLSLSEAVSGIIARSFSPLWDRKGMHRAVEIIERLVRDIPCYELMFRPDRDVIEYIRSLDI